MLIQLTGKGSHLDHKPSPLPTPALLAGFQVNRSDSSTEPQIKKADVYTEKQTERIPQKALRVGFHIG